MRIVLDTNILIRANPRAYPLSLARELLSKIMGGPHVLVVSAPILAEVRRVLSYPNVQARWPLTPEDIADYLFLLAEAGDSIESVPESSPVIIRDPDDDPILQTAIAGNADVLCSRDSAFSDKVVEEVCRARNIRVLTDIALIRELRSET